MAPAPRGMLRAWAPSQPPGLLRAAFPTPGRWYITTWVCPTACSLFPTHQGNANLCSSVMSLEKTDGDAANYFSNSHPSCHLSQEHCLCKQELGTKCWPLVHDVNPGRPVSASLGPLILFHQNSPFVSDPSYFVPEWLSTCCSLCASLLLAWSSHSSFMIYPEASYGHPRLT